jgi:hypothetical protein
MTDSEKYKELKEDKKKIWTKIMDSVTLEEEKNYTMSLIRLEEEKLRFEKEINFQVCR